MRDARVTLALGWLGLLLATAPPRPVELRLLFRRTRSSSLAAARQNSHRIHKRHLQWLSRVHSACCLWGGKVLGEMSHPHMTTPCWPPAGAPCRHCPPSLRTARSNMHVSDNPYTYYTSTAWLPTHHPAVSEGGWTGSGCGPPCHWPTTPSRATPLQPDHNHACHRHARAPIRVTCEKGLVMATIYAHRSRRYRPRRFYGRCPQAGR